ncbi:AAA family ATPase [Bradyrhizobium sp. McL0615]|uniref:ATP-binding protein n=1 Tax=Bradyrhizobium sp. McL0615 TaxID=3415673 RepID=UPI003CE87DA2
MRIRKLGLRRYGKFTDAFIDFGERAVGKPDMHIVYGPNEAGKSTAMSGCTDLIYGIPPQSKFNFLHPYAAMRIEAEIEISGSIRNFSRIKRPHNSLLDEAGNAVPDALLLGELGGLDRNAFQTMFCLDDETLEAGGESILASKGDLGHLLFSATAGLADLSDRLDSAQEEAEAFFRPGRRSGILAELKKTVAALKEERERTDTLATEYARLVVERDEAAAAYAEALSQRSRTRVRIDEVRRLINALPRLQTFRVLSAELLPLAPLPEAPPSWNQELPALTVRQVKLAAQTQSVAETIADLRDELEGLVVNASACGLKGRVELLTDLRARYITAEKDLPDRRLSLGLAEQTIARVLTLIDHSSEQNPARLVLSVGVTGWLRNLMEERSGVESALASAEAELTKADEALSEAEATVDEHGAGLDEATTAVLTASIASARRSDDVARLRAADRVCAERADELEDRLIELLPWTGGRNELLSVPVPTPERLQEWISTEANLSREIAIRQGEFDRLDAEAKRLEAKIEVLGSAAGVISDQEAVEARSEREAAWAAHKSALDATTAAEFESSMRKLDLIAEQRSGQAAAIADLNRALLDTAEVGASLELARRQLEESLGGRATVNEEVENSLRAIGTGLDGTIGLAGLNLWMQKRQRAIEAQGKLTAAEREWRRAQADAAVSRDRIAETIRAAGVDISRSDDIATMLAAGQAALDRAVEAKSLRAIVEGRRRDLKARERRLDEARLAERSWSAAWREACAACWLGERGSEPTTAVVRETLKALTELGSALEKKAELTDRISKMERDQSRFRAEVEALAALIGLLPTPSDALARCEAVVDCVASATKALDRRLEIESRLAAEQDKARSTADEMAEVQSRASIMMNHFGTTSLAEVDVHLRSLARRSDIEARLSQAREEILGGMKVETIEQAEDALNAIERGALEAELIELKARLEDEDSRSHDRFAARNKAEDRIAAVGGDAAVAALESKRRTVLITIEDRALEYLKLKLGIAAAERALRVYRDRHRSSMMARASEAFALISRGAYSELFTHPSNGRELLIAKGSDGSSKVASELSKGTRFQLYLALRVAGYHEFAQARAPAPFLADDIMETFDDFRAEEAFRLLAAMAGKGQIVYFTHHRHLCEIAKAVEPSIKIHILKAEPARGWAVSILREAGAIRECEEHGWMQDCADPHARERALEIARRNPLVGLSDRAAAAVIGEVLDDFGDRCPECPSE